MREILYSSGCSLITIPVVHVLAVCQVPRLVEVVCLAARDDALAPLVLGYALPSVQQHACNHDDPQHNVHEDACRERWVCGVVPPLRRHHGRERVAHVVQVIDDRLLGVATHVRGVQTEVDGVERGYAGTEPAANDNPPAAGEAQPVQHDVARERDEDQQTDDNTPLFRGDLDHGHADPDHHKLHRAGRRAVLHGLELVITEAVDDDGGEPDRTRAHGGDQAKQERRPCDPVGQTLLGLVPVPRFLLSTVSLRQQPVDGNRLFALGQKPSLLRREGHHEVEEHAHHERKCSAHQEADPPHGNAQIALSLGEAVEQEGGQDLCDGVAGDPRGSAQPVLAFLVVGAGDDNKRRRHTPFEKSQKSPNGDKACKCCRRCKAHAHSGPNNNADSRHHFGRKLTEQIHVHDLGGQLGQIEGRRAPAVLGAVQMQVLAQPHNHSIRQRLLVQILRKEHQTHHRQHVGVNLAHHLFLLFLCEVDKVLRDVAGDLDDPNVFFVLFALFHLGEEDLDLGRYI
ncbi:hypothetical protein KL941_004368 [Ogataea angusta]|nr:hypothetical protein KL941_004368 [Ogataea angusta]